MSKDKDKKKDKHHGGVIQGLENIGGNYRIISIGPDTPDHWGPWEGLDLTEYVRRDRAIEAAKADDKKALKALLAQYGLSSYEEFEAIQMTFLKHFAQDPRYSQAQVNVALEAQQAEVRAAVTPELLEPIYGVTLELYATVSAYRTQLRSAAEWPALLAYYGMDESRFAWAEHGWLTRMRTQTDPNASAALAQEYARYFAAAGQGPYGATGQAVSANVGVGQAVGQQPAGGEPCTLDRYAEIMAAQAVWSEQGQDVNQMLKQQFGMTAMDWSNVSAYWMQKFTADYTLMEKLTKKQAKYEKRYRAGGGKPDGDVSF